jgi:hypothetical protein
MSSGGWDQLSAAAKADRIKRMLESRARSRASRASKPLPKGNQVVEVEHISVPVHEALPAKGDLEALASLIVAVWRKL